MARNKLTDTRAAAIKKPGRYSDGGGLYLLCDDSGRKRWCFLFRWKSNPLQPGPGRQREMGLGSYHDVSLAAARKLAAVARAQVAEGRDPILARKISRAEVVATKTFGAAADDYLAVHKGSWKNRDHIRRWERVLSDEYCKALRPLPVAGISADHVAAVLQPIWNGKAETANRVRIAIEQVLNYARVKGWRDKDAANAAVWRGNLKLLLPRRQMLQRGHQKALPYEALPEFMQKLKTRPSSVSALALEFTILTCARTSETIGMAHSEVDERRQVWTVPAARMKGVGALAREHRVPLTTRMLEIVLGMRQLDSPWVFPGQDGRQHLSEAAMYELVKEMEVKVTVHGFRSTFSDWVGEETSWPRDVREAALAHKFGDDAELAYRRGDALRRRRMLMEDWELFCLTGTVRDRSGEFRTNLTPV